MILFLSGIKLTKYMGFILYFLYLFPTLFLYHIIRFIFKLLDVVVKLLILSLKWIVKAMINYNNYIKSINFVIVLYKLYL